MLNLVEGSPKKPLVAMSLPLFPTFGSSLKLEDNLEISLSSIVYTRIPIGVPRNRASIAPTAG